MDKTQLLTTKQAADFLEIEVKDLQELKKSGKLTPVKLGGKLYYTKSDILNEPVKKPEPIAPTEPTSKRQAKRKQTAKEIAEANEKATLTISKARGKAAKKINLIKMQINNEKARLKSEEEKICKELGANHNAVTKIIGKDYANITEEGI